MKRTSPDTSSRRFGFPTAAMSIASSALIALLVAGTGCGAARQEAASPASPAATNVGSAGASSVPEPAPEVAAPPADVPSTPATVNPSTESDQRSGPSSDFERAARMVDTASADCRQACRALASMDRACGQLCQLDADATCEGDKARLRSARKRVRASCGSCPDGTSVEPDGPIPQPR